MALEGLQTNRFDPLLQKIDFVQKSYREVGVCIQICSLEPSLGLVAKEGGLLQPRLSRSFTVSILDAYYMFVSISASVYI